MTAADQVSIPTWKECEDAILGGCANPLQRFIYENEPADTGVGGFQTEDDFRRMLTEAIAYALELVNLQEPQSSNCGDVGRKLEPPADPRDGSLKTHEDEAVAALIRHDWSEPAAREFLQHVAQLDRPITGECICPKCGLRHGSSNLDGGF